jgi:hypothetical protein
VYEKIIDDKNIYTTRKIPLPRPEFYVLYNGAAPYPAETVIKLSDSFESLSATGLSDGNPALELIVKVININQGMNEEIVNKCQTLAGYSVFVGKVREYLKDVPDLQEAMKLAIKYCLEHDILKEFFDQNSKEIFNMLMTEWNWDDAKEVWFEEGVEKGIEKERQYFLNLLNQGLSLDEIRQRLDSRMIITSPSSSIVEE